MRNSGVSREIIFLSAFICVVTVKSKIDSEVYDVARDMLQVTVVDVKFSFKVKLKKKKLNAKSKKIYLLNCLVTAGSLSSRC